MTPGSPRRPEELLEPPVISSEAFDRLRALIEKRLGIQTPASKKALIEARLSSGLRGRGLTANAYVQRTLDSGNAEATQRLLELFTTHETRFFREAHHFRILTEHAVQTTDRSYRVWCAAASSGEEPWSIAMTLAELEHPNRPEPIILATDVSTRILARARSGVYAASAIEGIPEPMRRRFLLRSKTGPVRYKMTRELRDWVTFEPLNLIDGAWSVARDFDAIFCRNVLIYFSRAQQRAVVQHLLQHLRPGGLLMLGHAESASEYGLPLESVGPTTFRRTR